MYCLPRCNRNTIQQQVIVNPLREKTREKTGCPKGRVVSHPCLKPKLARNHKTHELAVIKLDGRYCGNLITWQLPKVRPHPSLVSNVSRSKLATWDPRGVHDVNISQVILIAKLIKLYVRIKIPYLKEWVKQRIIALLIVDLVSLGRMWSLSALLV